MLQRNMSCVGDMVDAIRHVSCTHYLSCWVDVMKICGHPVDDHLECPATSKVAYKHAPVATG